MNETTRKESNPIVEQLLSKLIAFDETVSDEITLRLGLLLERQSPYSYGETFYKKMLPPELWNIEIDEPTIAEAVKTFADLVQRRKLSPTVMIFAKGLKHDDNILNMLLDYFSSNISYLSENDISEALNSIDHFLFAQAPETKGKLPENLASNLETLESLTKSENSEIKRFADNILNKVRGVF